jgi:ribosomal protein S18 acetylase RimI-like enzyme
MSDDAGARELAYDERTLFRAFAAGVPMSAHTPLAVERCGDAPFDHFGGESVEVGVTFEGRPAAYAHAAVASFCPPQGDGEPVRMAYVGDIRVDPAVQRRRLGTRLLDVLADALVARGVTDGFCFVNDGNAAVLGLFASGRSRMRGAASGSFRTGSRLLVARPRASRGAFVRVDPVALAGADRWAERLTRRPFAQAMRACDLARIAAAAGRDCVVLARRAAPEAPVAAIWNQRARRRLRVLALPPVLHGVTAAWRAAARWTGGAPPPRAGEPWSAAELCWLEPGSVPDGDVLAESLAVAWEMGSHFLNVAFDRGDASPRGPLWQWTTSHLVTLRFDGGPPAPFDGETFAHDLSRI